MFSLGALAAPSAATGPAAPFILAAAALVGPLTSIIKGMISGCGQSCIEATKYADTAAVYLDKLKTEYLRQPQPRCREAQQATLQYIDGVFSWLEQGCMAVGGDAGRRCIDERIRPGVDAPWCANSPDASKIRTANGCNWIALFRDPVANDPNVKVCTVTATGGGNVLGSILGGDGGGMDTTMLLLIVLLVVIAIKRK